MREAGERLAGLVESLVAIPSESRDESAILVWIRERLPDPVTVVEEGDAVLYARGSRRPGAPLILLAGHVDTVPVGRCAPGRRGATIHGRGAADMKGGLAVMLEVAGDVAAGRPDRAPDVGFLFFGREELPFRESALRPFLEDTSEVREAALAIVLEPTANRLELGCLGNLTATVTFTGEAAHTSRPWLGRNAIHAAVGALNAVADSPRAMSRSTGSRTGRWRR